MKIAILISIKSQHSCNILNLIKLLEIRKKFPKDYVGWVYIYVTKALPHLSKTYVGDYEVYDDTQWDKEWLDLNGKVVARFWCDKVDEYVNGSKLAFENGTYIFGTNADFETILKPSCLTEDELYDYCEDLSFKAIHITKLEIFDKPKELQEFRVHKILGCEGCCEYCDNQKCRLTKAPQSYCYIETEE